MSCITAHHCGDPSPVTTGFDSRHQPPHNWIRFTG